MSFPRNFFLVGLMGSGKTTVGSALAKKLKQPFFDSDHELERRTGVSISTIFEHEQEAGFRRRESRLIDELTQHQGIVLATGGGAVLCEENRSWLKGRGTVFYLHASPDDLWLRTRRDKNRPLLQIDNPRDKLASLYTERDPLYRACAHVVLEIAPSVHALVDMILAQLDSQALINSSLKQG